MKVAVIGAGWAGLSAALTLQAQGLPCTVFEAAPIVGGRARSVPGNRLHMPLDNGQHILISAYTQTLSLLRSLHDDLDTLCARLPLTWETATGQFSLKASPLLPNRLALGWALLRAKGLGLRERARAVQALATLALARWQLANGGQTVEQWLQTQHQPETLCRLFWRPLCLATMNTPADQACAQLFAFVLRDSLGRGAKACQIILPKVDLGRLWDSPQLRSLDLRLRRPVRQLALEGAGIHGIHIEQEAFDAVIVATPAAMACKLLKRLPQCSVSPDYLAPFQALSSLPIATLYLRLAEPWPLPAPMLMLEDDPKRGHFGQWVFDRSAFMQTDTAPLLSVVISNAQGLTEHTEPEIVRGVLAQLRTQLQRAGPMPDITGHQLIVEKRATFAARPDTLRPTQKTPWPGVFVAGDWTDTGYPAVLEGAVRSGQQAAKMAICHLQARRPAR